MPIYVLPFPAIDPVLITLGPLAIRWYSLAYIAGFAFGWWLARRLVARVTLWGRSGPPCTPQDIDDAIVWAAVAGIIGGRLAFVFVYNAPYYVKYPLEILQVWHGGMAFHGGIVGAVIGLWLFARRRGFALLGMLDLAACVAGIGIMLGRLANFIRGELWGRTSDVPWAMVFPDAGPLPRHPSQLYQAGLEGLLLFAALLWIATHGGLKKRGFLAGCFGLGYGLARFCGEFFREPDAQLGFLYAGATMGQLLSLPLILVGAALIVRAREAA